MRSNFGLYSVLGTAPFTVRRWLAIVVLVSTAATASAATLYVDAASTNAVPPFTNWASAAVTIQDAVDAAVDGDEIVVTNGVYQTGARAVYGMSNRVAVTKPVTVRSVNGPAYTSIVGHGPIGENAIRCAYLTNGAVLAGFTLTNGATRYPIGFLGDDCGGAVWCESQSAVVTNCVLTGNAASDCGGAALRGTLNNCALIGNSVWFGGGGGAYRSTLNNCTLAGNFGDDGGGANYSVLNNCILTYNLGTWGGGVENSTLNNCILTRNSAEFGSGANTCTLTNCIVVGNSASPGGGGGVIWSTLNNCIVYYNSSADGEENYYGSVFNNSCTTPAPESGVGNITNAPLFVNTNGWSNLRLQSNSPCINAGNNAYVTTSTDLDGRPRVVDGTVDIGAYEWHGAIRYVSATSTNPIAPYSSWASAAVTIQDAVDAAAPGDEIVVTNGVYQTGARAVYGMSNRVAVTKPVTVRSVNGPEVTTIRGAGPIGENAIRCVYLTNGAMLAGFTLTNGATQIGDSEMDSITNSGGGVWCESQSAVITNCVLAGNSASFEGGGVYSGTLNNCIVASNAAWEFGGGAARSMLNSCTLENNFADSNGGGGAYGSTLNNCTLTRNTADPGSGGGVRDCDLNNCVLTDNKGNGGGGASDSTLNNCTLADNSATSHWSDEPSGGGASSSRLYNCIITGNTGTGVSGSTLNNCVLTNNSGSAGGGAQYSTLTNCVVSGNSGHEVGGGAFLSTLYNCVLTGNWGHFYGGGAFVCTLYNCTLAGNEASYYGGGASRCTLNNCTVVGNFAGREEGGGGGGTANCVVSNSIVYFNVAYTVGDNSLGDIFNYSCTTPAPANEVGNITNAPLFVDTNGWSNLRLQSNSPCINAGNSAYVTVATDLDGFPRIAGGTVDIGAYEFQFPASTISYAWLQQSGLPTDGSADYVDTDHDQHNNWQEWRCGTDPTNALSVLRLLPPVSATGGLALTWLSVTNRSYLLERSTNQSGTPFFSPLATLPGQPATNTFIDTNAPPGPAFYRVLVLP